MIVLTLIQNVALLVALSVILIRITRRLGRRSMPTMVLSGLLFGMVAVVGMMTPLRIVPGVIFDARSVVLAVAGFTGGPVVAGIAALIAAAYRLALGGGGAWVGVTVVLEASLLGVAMYYLRRRFDWVSRFGVLLVFGLVVHIAMLATQLALPGGVGPMLVRQIGPSVVVFFSLATALVCLLLLDQERSETAAEELRASEQRYRLLAENTADIIWEVDLELRGVYANQAVERILGYTPEEFVGLPASVYCSPGSLQELLAAGAEAIAELPARSPRTTEAIYITRTGDIVDVEIVATVIVGADGGPTGFQGVTRDVSARKAEERAVHERKALLERLVEERTAGLQAVNEELQQTAAELERTNEALREASEAKTQFLRAMSHELRTPLNSIIGFSEILHSGLAGEMNEEQERQAGMINHAGKHLLSIINDILDLARIEAHQVRLEVEEFDGNLLAADVLESMTAQASEKGLSLGLKLGVSPVVIRSDPRKVRQILLNLLSNAVKFTSEGSVELLVSGPDRGAVSFAVRDTGRGVPEELRERVFSEYIQAEGPHEEGTGLGLAISRSLAGILGGMLTLESVLGEGSTFTLSLPIDADPDVEEA